MYKQKTQQGFTLLELLIVIAIIGILAGVISVSVSSARVKARDAKRMGDIRQTITALEQYYIKNGTYPTGTASTVASGSLLSDTNTFNGSDDVFTPNYLPFIPSAPSPADGNCLDDSGRGNNNYWYETDGEGKTYTLTFCLGKGNENWAEGARIATPEGVK